MNAPMLSEGRMVDRAAWRREHGATWGDWCEMCGKPLPCPGQLLLDELDAKDARLQEYEAAQARMAKGECAYQKYGDWPRCSDPPTPDVPPRSEWCAGCRLQECKAALRDQGYLVKTISGQMVWHAEGCNAGYAFDLCISRCKKGRDALAHLQGGKE